MLREGKEWRHGFASERENREGNKEYTISEIVLVPLNRSPLLHDLKHFTNLLQRQRGGVD